jgi:hypothetical protein
MYILKWIVKVMIKRGDFASRKNPFRFMKKKTEKGGVTSLFWAHIKNIKELS